MNVSNALQISGRKIISLSSSLVGTQQMMKNNISRRALSSSSSRGSKNSVNVMKRPRLVKKVERGSVDGVWYCSTSSGQSRNSSSLDMGRYGLKRLDYKTLDPPVWTIPPHPPTKNVQERVLFPLTLVVVAGFGLWAYMNPEEEDMKEYWQRVSSGQILLDDDDDDDDDDEDWDDDDEE
jgi:hypothetical protein